MPHRQHVEAAAELQPLGLRREPQAELDQVREDLVALALEMMLGGPQHVEAELVHRLRHVARREERLAQPLVRIAPVVRGRAVQPDVVELDLADIEHVELVDHRASTHIAGCYCASLLQNASRGYKRSLCIFRMSCPTSRPIRTPRSRRSPRWLKAKPGERGTPQLFRLFGYAGTGKTTLARHLAAHIDGEVKFAAFTGKAALVMRAQGLRRRLARSTA